MTAYGGGKFRVPYAHSVNVMDVPLKREGQSTILVSNPRKAPWVGRYLSTADAHRYWVTSSGARLSVIGRIARSNLAIASAPGSYLNSA